METTDEVKKDLNALIERAHSISSGEEEEIEEVFQAARQLRLDPQDHERLLSRIVSALKPRTAATEDVLVGELRSLDEVWTPPTPRRIIKAVASKVGTYAAPRWRPRIPISSMCAGTRASASSRYRTAATTPGLPERLSGRCSAKALISPDRGRFRGRPRVSLRS